MSKGKMRAKPNTAGAKKKVTGAQRKARKNVAKHSTIILWFTAIALVAAFVGRWIVAIDNGYYSAFVQVDATAASAVQSMGGLSPTAAERETLLPLQKQWDLFASSRLRDEVTVQADDGTPLHGYLYNEGSDVTVVVLRRYYEDGTADFPAGPYLHELTGCNILLPDARCHGGSGGDAFTYGLRERYDIPVWLDWADSVLGPQTFILWGEGTGANTALMAAADGLLPGSVAFLVAESPYASLHELAKESIWKWYRVPAFPFLYTAESKIARSAGGFSVKEAETAALLADSGAAVPVLFLQSSEDTYILPAWTQAVAESYPGPHETIAGGGSHGTVYAAEHDAVNDTLAAWWALYG